LRQTRLYLAPIRGITNCVYRNEYSRLFKGYDFALAPFIVSCYAENSSSKVLRDLFVERNDSNFKIIPQILSNDASHIISLASAMYDLGYKVVNINLGCPHKKVRNKMRGSGLLAHPELICNLLDEIIPAIPNKLSLKVRLGGKEKDEFSKILPLLADYPLHEIIVHPRTGQQMYKGKADLAAFKDILAAARHPLVYNGDIDTVQKFKFLSDQLPEIDSWMIGRGGLVNPFLPELIKGLVDEPLDIKLARFRQFHDNLLSIYQRELNGPAHQLSKMKEIWVYWADFFLKGKSLLKAISRAQSLGKYNSLIYSFFHNEPELIIHKTWHSLKNKEAET